MPCHRPCYIGNSTHHPHAEMQDPELRSGSFVNPPRCGEWHPIPKAECFLQKAASRRTSSHQMPIQGILKEPQQTPQQCLVRCMTCDSQGRLGTRSWVGAADFLLRWRNQAQKGQLTCVHSQSHCLACFPQMHSVRCCKSPFKVFVKGRQVFPSLAWVRGHLTDNGGQRLWKTAPGCPQRVQHKSHVHICIPALRYHPGWAETGQGAGPALLSSTGSLQPSGSAHNQQPTVIPMGTSLMEEMDPLQGTPGGLRSPDSTALISIPPFQRR